MISGSIAKKTIGDGSKTGLLYVLLRDCGPAFAANFLDRFSKLCARYFGMHRGFSIGISDVSPSPKLKKMKFDILSAGYKKVSAVANRQREVVANFTQYQADHLTSHYLWKLGGRGNQEI